MIFSLSISEQLFNAFYWSPLPLRSFLALQCLLLSFQAFLRLLESWLHPGGGFRVFTIFLEFWYKGTNFFCRESQSDMIQLLFLVLFVEGAIAFLLLIKIGPLRELVIKSLDQMKMGKGPATVKTIAGTMSVILLSNLMSIVKIQNKGAKLGTMSPMDQVLWRTHLLEASLMGQFLSLFLDWLL